MTVSPELKRISNISRGLDKAGENLPFILTPKQHYSLLRKTYLRAGWDEMKKVAAKLARDYEARQKAHLREFHEAIMGQYKTERPA